MVLSTPRKGQASKRQMSESPRDDMYPAAMRQTARVPPQRWKPAVQPWKLFSLHSRKTGQKVMCPLVFPQGDSSSLRRCPCRHGRQSLSTYRRVQGQRSLNLGGVSCQDTTIKRCQVPQHNRIRVGDGRLWEKRQVNRQAIRQNARCSNCNGWVDILPRFRLNLVSQTAYFARVW